MVVGSEFIYVTVMWLTQDILDRHED